MSHWNYRARAIRAGYRHMEEKRFEAQSTIESQRPVPGICRCGGLKKKGHVICHDCWKLCPWEIRLAFRSVGTRRDATRQLLEFAESRKTIPPTSPSPLPAAGDTCGASSDDSDSAGRVRENVAPGVFADGHKEEHS